MTNNDTDTTKAQAQEPAEGAQLSFSDIKAAFKGNGFKTDLPGGLMLIGCDGTHIQWGVAQLNDDSAWRVKIPLLSAALSQLCLAVAQDDPEALALVAKWYGRHQQCERLAGVTLADLLKSRVEGDEA